MDGRLTSSKNRFGRFELRDTVAPPLWRASFCSALVGVLCLALVPLDPSALPLDTGWDKSNHALAFLVLGVLGAKSWPRKLHLILALLLLFGVVIEIA